jgi:GNAT superfamily N-acetyltransferase
MDILLADAAHAHDIAAMASAFRDHLNRSTPTDADFLRSVQSLLASADAEFFVCRDGDALVGYVLQRYRHSMWAGGLEATVEDLFVRPTARKGGLGKALVEFAIARAARRGCVTACLDTNEFNAASTRIYTQLGFDAVSRRWNGRQIFYRRVITPRDAAPLGEGPAAEG